MAYEVLNEPKYLEVAKRAAESLLQAQNADGWWTYGWTKTPQGVVLEYADRAPIEDHVQSAPILLLLYLNRVTGDTKYLQAAMRGLDFLRAAQNPNGSWSHHFNPAKGHGETASGKPRGGEFNDFTTTGTGYSPAASPSQHRVCFCRWEALALQGEVGFLRPIEQAPRARGYRLTPINLDETDQEGICDCAINRCEKENHREGEV